jgi:ribosomal protein L11 methyltransferase
VIRLAVRVRREDAELVLAELLELAPGGVEEAQVGSDLVEYAVYGAPGELPELPDLRAAAGGALVEIATSELSDDWSERWKRFHHPVLVEPPVRRPDRDAARRPDRDVVRQPSYDRMAQPGYDRATRPSHAAPAQSGGDSVPALHVRPPWEAPSDREDVEEIVIDPGQAFGTGGHATTSLCLELLLELAAADPARGSLIDVGTGSGVLAIAAARLGYGPVLALDNDPESVAAARDNATVNGVSIDVRGFDLRRARLPSLDGALAPAGSDGSIVLANLLRPLLLDLALSIGRPGGGSPGGGSPGSGSLGGGSPGNVIVGGLLVGEVGEVVEAFGEQIGLRERERRISGEWAAVWLTGGEC